MTFVFKKECSITMYYQVLTLTTYDVKITVQEYPDKKVTSIPCHIHRKYYPQYSPMKPLNITLNILL